MTQFQELNLLPSVVRASDSSGGQSQKISLASQESKYRIIFGDDRVDVIFVDERRTSKDFVWSIAEQTAKILETGFGYKFGRIGYITEAISDGVSEEIFEKYRSTFMPYSGDGSIEWIYRWVKRVDVDGHDLVFCYDVQRTSLQKIEGASIEDFVAIKESFDLSTTNLDLSPRINASEAITILDAMFNEAERVSEFNRRLLE